MYKMLSKVDLAGIIEGWLKQTTVYAPVRQGDYAEFQPLSDPSQADLSFVANTRYPPKSLFLPQSEAMFRVQGAEFESIEAQVSPQLILGIRACDARAVQLLDGVFVTEEHPDPYWTQKRERTTLVVLGCTDPCETCFCTAVGSGPFDKRAADVMLIDVGDEYVADMRNGKGRNFFDHLPDASQAQIDAARQVQTMAASKMEKPFETEGVVDKLYSLFESDFWFEIQQSCLGCGVCTFLCPTCHCFDIADEVQRSERVRNWDTCMFRIYSQEASGHNPRPTNVERTRQRIMHKYAYFPELYEEIGCTGCGRCVRYCPVNLDIRHMIRSAQAREESQAGG
jgi:ferredoxin